jgi:hypothetical protein
MSSWIYAGIFLDNKSKSKLKSKFPIPQGWNKYFDHMTIVFNDGTPKAAEVKSIVDKMINREVRLKVVSSGISDKAYAVHVELQAGIPCANKISHITLATSPTGKPVDSNYIEDWIDIYEDIYVTGKIQIVS